MNILPTDEEYLEQLSDLFLDDITRELHLIFNAQDEIDNEIWRDFWGENYEDIKIKMEIQKDENQKKYALSNKENEEIWNKIHNEMKSPSGSLGGSLISTLKKSALSMLDSFLSDYEDYDQLVLIPVGLIPTRHFNASTIKTPRGGNLVLLNSGVIWLISCILRSFIAFLTWHDPEPICRDYSQETFAKTLLAFAKYNVSGERRYLTSTIKIVGDAHFSDSDTLYVIASYIELFILLHEYGHIILKHSRETAQLFINSNTEVVAYTNSQNQEFEADEFAFRCLADAYSSFWPLTDLAVFAGILLKFFQLCEFLVPAQEHKSHPTAEARWERIKQYAGVQNKPLCLANQIDHGFSSLLSILDSEIEQSGGR